MIAQDTCAVFWALRPGKQKKKYREFPVLRKVPGKDRELEVPIPGTSLNSRYFAEVPGKDREFPPDSLSFPDAVGLLRAWKSSGIDAVGAQNLCDSVESLQGLHSPRTRRTVRKQTARCLGVMAIRKEWKQ